MTNIPPSVIGVAAPVLDAHYTRTQLINLFLQHGFPGDAPEGVNKSDMCRSWMRRANNDTDDALSLFGNLIAEMMDTDYPELARDSLPDLRARINAALAKENLTYHRGGKILGAKLSGPTLSLGDRLKKDSVGTLQKEYDRAYQAIASDPEAAVTAACAILESVCRTYLEDEGAPAPTTLTLGPLWNATAKHLGLSPASLPDEDMRRILSGLYSVADGVAALRTHQSSAHGRPESSKYELLPRHARLAVHAAHTMALFILETWEAKRSPT
jgi:hypothetical protein